MSTKDRNPMQALTGPGADAFRLWISFFPVAPVFGVKWVFADAMPGVMPGMGLLPPGMTMASAFAMRSARPAEEPEAAPGPVAHERVSGQPDPETAEVLAEAQAELEAAVDLGAEALDEASIAAAPAPAADAAEPEAVAAPPAAPEAMVLPFPPAAAREDAADAAGEDAEPLHLEPPRTLYHVPPAEVDDLKMIRGIGPGLESRLNALGIYRFDQIAEFTETDLAWVDGNMTTFKGRCFRDDWVGQAKALLG